MNKLIHLTILLWGLSVPGRAQESTLLDLGGLNIGDTLAYPVLVDVLNAPDGLLDMESFKGKLIILDFWHTGCSGCVAAFPKMDSLQQRFENNVQIIAVNTESLDSTERFFSKLKAKWRPRFPLVTNDRVLNRLFPHKLVPHHVWVDENGVVRYITGGVNTNEKSIREFLAGRGPIMSERPRLVDTALRRGMLLNTAEQHALSYSVLTRTIPGSNTRQRMVWFREGVYTGNRISRNSISALELLLIAFSEGGRFNFEAADSRRFAGLGDIRYTRPLVDTIYDDWYRNYSYNYDVMMEGNPSDRLFKYMQDHLIRSFNINSDVRMEYRMVYEFRLEDERMFKARQIQEQGYRPSPDSLLYFRNRTPEDAAYLLQKLLVSKGLPDIVTNGIEIPDKMTFFIDRNALAPFSIAALNRELHGYGLTLKRVRRKVPILLLEAEGL